MLVKVVILKYYSYGYLNVYSILYILILLVNFVNDFYYYIIINCVYLLYELLSDLGSWLHNDSDLINLEFIL